MQQQDYIERMIAQVAAAIGRILGFVQSEQPDQAERELAAAWSGLLAMRRADVERLDEATLVALLGNKRLAAAMLLDAEADLKRSQGQGEAAERLTSLAARLRE